MVVSFFPRVPAGWNLAKDFSSNSFNVIRHIAIISPTSNCIPLLVVGAKLFGHASFSIGV